MQCRLTTMVPVAAAAVCLALGMITGPIMADTRPSAIPSTAGAATSTAGAASSSGTWGTAREVPGVTAIAPAVGVARAWSVSCASPGNCAAVGYLEEPSRQTAFVANEMWATSTSLSLSPARVTYGDERAGQVSVTVSSAAGTPPGTVTVRSGATSVCTITLSSGTGTCAPSATLFPAGIRQLTATYGGSADFAVSASATQSLTVGPAATTTALTLASGAVTYGNEQAEHAAVTVSAQYGGTPTGTVTVNSGSTTICTITLASGRGTCILAPSEVRPGIYALRAYYAGSSDFGGSASASKALTVVK